ncbi:MULTISPECIES: PEP-CTERM sorting domain-containing protein [unclassified Anabaena]|uniref:PEP-CTERM sorting domain-containing protein n=1 Tax=unclassified Anabaena TaxID=2619674 RepID=UPI002B1F0FE9|nr:PEP-CTERM sorting domain-containing protein [Anabaena sp. UHCC 0399]MEA5564604.1 PEP-CTERM sorting domain-containing protein [Anabaena sp. UHCC 0399]
MKSICNQITAKVAVVAVTSMATLINVSSANAATFEIDWQGDQGYTATGNFSYDDIFEGTIVTRDQLSRFAISFFNPDGNLLQSFKYSFPNPADTTFNFNFDTVTKTVLQTGNYDAANGFDLGIDFNTAVAGLDFYTYLNPAEGLPTARIFLKDDLSPEVCSTFPNCRLDNGGQLTATSVPEPGAILGLLVVGSLGGFLKKKTASN